MTITRRVEEIGDDLHDQLQSNAQKFVSVSLALDESTDIVSTAQLLIFFRGVTNDFQVLELLALVALKKRTRGCDIFEAVRDAIDKSNLKWPKMRQIFFVTKKHLKNRQQFFCYFY